MEARRDNKGNYKCIVGDNAGVVTAVTTAMSTGWQLCPPVIAMNDTQCAVTLVKSSKSGDSLVVTAV